MYGATGVLNCTMSYGRRRYNLCMCEMRWLKQGDRASFSPTGTRKTQSLSFSNNIVGADGSMWTVSIENNTVDHLDRCSAPALRGSLQCVRGLTEEY